MELLIDLLELVSILTAIPDLVGEAKLEEIERHVSNWSKHVVAEKGTITIVAAKATCYISAILFWLSIIPAFAKYDPYQAVAFLYDLKPNHGDNILFAVAFILVGVCGIFNNLCYAWDCYRISV